MSRSLIGLVMSIAACVLGAGCQPHQKLDAQGNPLPTYTGQVVRYGSDRSHFEPVGQSGWVDLTQARPGESAEAKRIDLDGRVGKRLTVQGLLMPGTGWIYDAEIVKEEK